jgi:spore germination cell wall hydrolase CwlJ-like protein
MINYIFVLLLALTPAHGFAIDSLPDNSQVCLAKNIYFEAGNQPEAGKVAVAHVVLNRVAHERFPDTICDVVHQTKEYKTSWKTGEQIPRRGMCQFSWYCDGKSDVPLDSVTYDLSYKLAGKIIAGEWADITEGSMWYHATRVYPYWAGTLNETVIINEHVFYK